MLNRRQMGGFLSTATLPGAACEQSPAAPFYDGVGPELFIRALTWQPPVWSRAAPGFWRGLLTMA